MSKRIVLISVLLTMVVCLACTSAGAGNLIIYTPEATPFLYEGHTYLPLQSTASFLGAPLRWDSAKRQSVMTYNGRDLALTPGKTSAWLNGKSVVLLSPPVVVGGRTYVPMDALKKYYGVPVEWYGDRSELKIKGPKGWGTAKVKSRPPWHGGPPPWAPAWGQRSKHGVSYHWMPGDQKNHKGEWKQKGKSQWQRSHAVPALGKHAQGNGQGQQKSKGQGKGH